MNCHLVLTLDLFNGQNITLCVLKAILLLKNCLLGSKNKKNVYYFRENLAQFRDILASTSVTSNF